MPSPDATGQHGHLEVETTWTPPSEVAVPDLTRVPGIAGVDEPVVQRLEARYVDTADLALVRAGVTLRRRVGGDDEGWHVKLPAPGGRVELHAPLGREGGRPPARLLDAVLARSHGAPLVPVARVVTERTTRVARDGSGAAVLLLADDHVVGTALVDEVAGAPVTWREWEAELAVAGHASPDDGATLLASVGEVLAAAGAEPAAVGRKIEVVLGHRVPGPRERPDHPLLAYLDEQVQEIVRRDPGVRRGDEDDVHRTRVACRRLRSVLATFRPLLDREVTDPLRDALRRHGRLLGAVRDPQVTASVLADLLDEQPRDLVMGPVRRRATRTLRDRARVATRELAQSMREPAYLDLLAALERLVVDPPWAEGRPPGRKAFRKTARHRVRHDWRRVRSRITAEESDRDLHGVRKAAKRLRYACEASAPALGDRVDPLRRASKAMTGLLGDRADLLAAPPQLRTIARAADAAGESTFTYGRLHALAESRAGALTDELDDAWRAVVKARLR